MKYFLTSLFFLFSAFSSIAQLVVDNAPPNNTAQNLVSNVLLGQGVQAFNITFNADSTQIGYFDGTNSNIGLDNGLVMTTGDLNLVVGPNNNSGLSLGGGNFGQSDPDLDQIVTPNGTNDAAVLEFDFIPSGDTIKFRYVFGSEEYLEWVNSSFNDVFGFFISGPGFAGPYANGAENIALVPGTTTPVSINNVNDVSNSTYYIDNGTGSSAPQNTDVTVTQLDGFTTVLEAVAIVQCGQTYHIKLAIADAGDASLDSGVFLEAESFTSNDILVNLEFASGNLDSDSSIVEGCTSATFQVLRNAADSADVVHFQLGGSAINGVDFVQIPDSVVLDSGVFQVDFEIEPILDSLAEGSDTLTISIERINQCGDTILQSVNLYILDDYTIALHPIDTVIGCPGDSVPLLVEVTNAIPEITWQWSTGDTITSSNFDTIWVAPIDTLETYYVTVFDSCAFSNEVDSVTISLVLTDPLVTTFDAVSPCPGQQTYVQAVGSGGSGHGFTYQWSTGSTSDTAQVSPTMDSTWYFVTVTDICTGLDTVDSAVVVFSINPPSAFIQSPVTISCAQPTAVQVFPFNGSGQGFSYSWSNGSTSDTAIVTPTSDTAWYYVTVTDVCNMLTVEDSVQIITQATPPDIILTPDQTIPCPLQQVQLSASGVGGSGSGYTYQWSTTETTPNITVTPMTTTTYTVTVGDGCGQLFDVDSITVTVSLADPLAVALAGDSVDCPGDSVGLLPAVTGGLAPLTYSWSTGSTAAGIVDFPNASTDYTISVTDGCGVVQTATATVGVPVFDPVVVLPFDTTVLCAGDPTSFTALAAGGSPGFTYAWSWDTLTATGATLSVNSEETTTYLVTATDQCGSTGTTSFVVNVPSYSPVVVSTIDSTLLCLGDSVILEFVADGGTGVYSYEWIPNGPGTVDTNNFFHYIPNGSQTVLIEVTDQCGVDAVSGIYVETEDCTVTGVNVITPNNDGMNEVLSFRHLEKHQNSHLAVFTRWGRKVYETDNYQNDWNGDTLKDGTYYYILTLEDGTQIQSFFTIIGSGR